MSKKRARQQTQRLLDNLQNITRTTSGFSPTAEPAPNFTQGEDITLDLDIVQGQAIQTAPDNSRNPRMKKFRFQLLHRWLTQTLEPCRAADIGGGKGLLAYLLAQDGWQTTVIDPTTQTLPEKYKDIQSGVRMKISANSQVRYLPTPFQTHHGAQFDLLIGMHAHGCNAWIIDAAAEYGCGFILFPCCVIDEPFFPRRGVHWLESLADYATRLGLPVHPIRLNFKGQNIGLFTPGKCKLKVTE